VAVGIDHKSRLTVCGSDGSIKSYNNSQNASSGFPCLDSSKRGALTYGILFVKVFTKGFYP
jgi:transcriptional accessory protein Tex/SPT6